MHCHRNVRFDGRPMVSRYGNSVWDHFNSLLPVARGSPNWNGLEIGFETSVTGIRIRESGLPELSFTVD